MDTNTRRRTRQSLKESNSINGDDQNEENSPPLSKSNSPKSCTPKSKPKSTPKSTPRSTKNDKSLNESDILNDTKKIGN